VSFWDRLRGRPRADETKEETDAADEAPAPERPELERLLRLGTAGGPEPDEALSLFRALRATPDEARGIDVVSEVARAGTAPEALVVAAAAALADRGERDRALALVTSGQAPCTSAEARMLAADLHETRGELAEALALVERVLVRDLDYPGARERHQRWRARLGLDAGTEESAARGAGDRAAVTIVSREPDAPFLLLREVARGGAGAVYEAQDRELGRRVALKVYHRAHHVDRDRAQLMHEARVAAALAGPSVVRVLDLDPARGWLALEWAALGSLKQRLKDGDRGSLLPIRAWALPLASALGRVHASGWVHHDVKPANVLFASPGHPLLADFGTARRTGEPSPPGSLGYVSPERLAGRASDPRDDVFGFGRVLEDAIDGLGDAPDATLWRAIAAGCTGPDSARPADGRAIVTRLRVELPPDSERPA
jgi:serine/threonine-protein kinase